MFHRKEVGLQVLAGVAPSSQTVEYSLNSVFAQTVYMNRSLIDSNPLKASNMVIDARNTKLSVMAPLRRVLLG
jgi:hypothetical protein